MTPDRDGIMVDAPPRSRRPDRAAAWGSRQNGAADDGGLGAGLPGPGHAEKEKVETRGGLIPRAWGCMTKGADIAAGAAGDRIDALQYLRAAAALMVLAYHTSHYVAYYRLPPGPIELAEARLGVWGVALFFALSGYLMARLAPATPPGRFLLHRVARIYPPYLLTVAGFSLLSPLILGYAFAPRFLPATLAPAGPAGYVLGVEWTLVYEVTFYVFIFLVAAAGGAWLLPAIAGGWLALVAAWNALAGPPGDYETPFIYTLPVSPANVAFICGLMVPALLRRLRVHPAWLAVAAALLAAELAGLLPQERFVASVASAVTVAALAGLPRGRGGLASRIGLRLGDASYALYLTHVPVVTAVLRWLPEAAPAPLAWLAAFAAAVAAGLISGAADVRAYRALRRRVDALRERAALRLAAAFAIFFLAVAAACAAAHLLDERRMKRAMTALGVITPALLAAPDPVGAVNAALAAEGRQFLQPAQALDGAARMPDGRVAARGWTVDLAAPEARTWIAVYCDGVRSGWVRRSQLRRDAAAALNAPDLGKLRPGYTATTAATGCPAGAQLVLVAADGRGRARALAATPAP